MEDHHDDCGEDIGAILDDESASAEAGELPFLVDLDSDSDDIEIHHGALEEGFEQLAVFGPYTSGLPDVPHTVQIMPNLSTLFGAVNRDNGASPMDICYCVDGTARVAMRNGKHHFQENYITTVPFDDTKRAPREFFEHPYF